MLVGNIGLFDRNSLFLKDISLSILLVFRVSVFETMSILCSASNELFALEQVLFRAFVARALLASVIFRA